MSELMNTNNSERGFRRQLLTTVSALSLLASVTMRDANAADEDTDRPTVWIELGGLAEHVSGQGEPFEPAFVAANPNSPVFHPVSPVQAQNPVPFSFGEEAKISFQPESSNWVFSATVNYGRSSNSKLVDHQTHGLFYGIYKYGVPQGTAHSTEDFADTQVQRSESHAVVDFQVGKDVGLGMFGRSGSSTLSLGVRFAQFSSRATFDVRARPDGPFSYLTLAPYGRPNTGIKVPNFHVYHATGFASRGFRGVGPSLSWNGSAPVAGNVQDGEVTFDWGVNAAILFGRQKANTHHQSSGYYHHRKYNISPYNNPPVDHPRAHSVAVPNVGGMAGASFRIQNVKVSAGYRADFFFGAIDGGIDTRKTETLGFYGPFASVSIGLGG